ncbi:exodeoxyribonuclease V subunit gamma [Agaribacter flavus]|uniref:RecBCD enzyme subunit RecC n=1 Tax=Agaribacter flavus TaxID=1902781 RepID=A0ABV7FN34_9ALTE
MFYFYPSNRLQHLAEMLNAVINSRHANPLAPTQILVQHTGMQHWLSVKLAELNGIAMNLSFPLPTRFVWSCCRDLLGDDLIPKQSPYKREILVWRIITILKNTQPNEQSIKTQIDRFIRADDGALLDDEIIFAFARQVADVFEQYIVFRPEWISAWEAQASDIVDNLESQESFKHLSVWQRWIWQELTLQAPQHPVNLQASALTRLKEAQQVLPADIYIFAINTLPVQYFSFFTALAEVTNVHFFMLNPCENYWGDAQSNKQIAYQLKKNTQLAPIELDDLNPLLRNMGQQGKEMINQVLAQDYLEISSFASHDDSQNPSLLQLLQDDIRRGTNANINAVPEHTNHCAKPDATIQVHGNYSQLRELQVLKDFLVNRFAEDSSLALRDVLIMCPAIEDYAPFIRAVFESDDAGSHSLPVSISDRRPIESETAVESFIQVISLNKTRFSLDAVMSPLVDKGLASSFSLTDDDLQKVQHWLESASVMWGIDSKNKAQILGSTEAEHSHTWSQGLARLIMGAVNQENIKWADEIACIEGIEGLNQVILGRFIAYLEWLLAINEQFGDTRNLAKWVKRLSKVLEQYRIGDDAAFGVSLIQTAINELSQNITIATCSDLTCSWVSIVTALKQLLSIPETKAKFMAGKITFCSMMPMRSVPFKIIGVLGLNQDKYPRKSVLSELDLMSISPRKLGDRSRANDDRYLFLEAILSAESTLYLSYLYRSAKDNAERLPSLVLTELLDYCHQRFGEANIPVQYHGLHPFSVAEFANPTGSSEKNSSETSPHKYFMSTDAIWFSRAQALLNTQESKKSEIQTPYRLAPLKTTVHLNELIRFYQNPIRYFANKRLQVYFPSLEKQGGEQAFDYTNNHRRKVRTLLLRQLSANQRIFGDSHENARDQTAVLNIQNASLSRLNQYFLESGDLPNLTYLDDVVSQETALMKLVTDKKATLTNSIDGKVNVEGFDFIYTVQVDADDCPLFFSVDNELSDYQYLDIYLHMLCYAVQFGKCETKAFYARMYRGKPKLEEVAVSIESKDEAFAQLQGFVKYFILGSEQPMLLHMPFAKDLQKVATAQEALKDEGVKNSWRKRTQTKSKANPMGLADDLYVQCLFGGVFPDLSEDLLQVYFDTYLKAFS